MAAAVPENDPIMLPEISKSVFSKVPEASVPVLSKVISVRVTDVPTN